MIVLDLSILNQKGTPMFYSDTLAARPAAGIVGRIFIATDSPFGIYRDTGTAWDQVAGAGSFSGSLATGQVAFGSATNTIAGNSDFQWDNTSKALSVLNTNSSSFSNIGIGANGGINARGLNLYAFGSTYSGVGAFSPSNVAISTGNLVTRFAFVSFGSTAWYNGGSAAANEVMQLTQNGRLLIGTTTDAGQRLQVNGDTFLKGASTTSFNVQNTTSNSTIRILNDGKLVFGDLAASAYPWIAAYDGQVLSPNMTNGSHLLFWNQNSDNSNAGPAGFGFNSSFSPAIGGIPSLIRATGTFATSAGSAGVAVIDLLYTINQTGTASGITRGLYIRPTLTSSIEWRSIQWDNSTGWGLYGNSTALNYLGGTLGIKTTSPYAPSTFSLDVNGGLLVKNTAGTTAQITLINADPSIGGNNGFLVALAGGTSGGSFVDFQGYYGTSIVGSTALRLNPAGGSVIVNSTTNSGEQFQVTGTLRVNGQTSGSAGGNSGQHLIINCDGTTYKIALLNP